MLYYVATFKKKGRICMGFAQNIKKYRTKSKLTQSELAKKLNISLPTIQGYEAGKFRPKTTEKYKAICDALNITYEELLDGEEEIPVIRITADDEKQWSTYKVISEISRLFTETKLSQEEKSLIMDTIVDIYKRQERENS